MNKLSHKIGIGVFGSLVMTSIATTFLVIRSERATLESELEYSGTSLARTVAASCVEPLLSEDYPYLETHIRKTASEDDYVVFVRVVQIDGDVSEVVARYPSEEEAHADLAEHVAFTYPVRLEDLSDEEDALDELPSDLEDDGLGLDESLTTLGYVQVGLSTHRLERLIWSNTLRMVVSASVTFLLLALVITLVLRRNVLVPIKDLEESAARMGSGDLETPVVQRSRDELGRLAVSMESMRVSLKASHDKIAQQVAELEIHGRMKDEFLANTSHELKTPLNGIIGLADSVIGGSYGELPMQFHQPLENLVGCGHRLRRMTEAILQFSAQAQTDGQPPKVRQRKNLRKHLESIVIDLKVNAASKGLELFITCPEHAEAEYRSSEFEELVRILTDNAIKYTERGWVEIVVARWPEGSRLAGFQIGVRDTGVGIAEEARERVFQPFVQGFDHETRSHEGVGLGLAIAMKHVERLGARIRLDSEVGRGTCFTVLVPEVDTPESQSPGSSAVDEAFDDLFTQWPEMAAPTRMEQPAASAPTAPNEVAPVGRKTDAATASTPRTTQSATCNVDKPGSSSEYRLLICDDDPINLEVLWGALHDCYEVTQAEGGAECLEALRSGSFDLLLLDIMMPQVSGYDVLRTMKEEGLLERIPVIVLSAKTSTESVVKGLGLGASDYLGKPFHREELLRRIGTQLEIVRHRALLEMQVREKSRALDVAEHANQIKTQFLANMSHEIRTPINGIVGFASLALLEEGEDREQLEEYIQSVLDCSQNLLRIVDNVLDVAKIEAAALELESEECRLVDLIEPLTGEWRTTASNLGLGFDLVVEEGLQEFRLRTALERARQTIDGVVDNALKFTPKGRVDVRVASTVLSEERPGILVEVRDTGVGIPTELHEEIFQPFLQADMDMNRQFDGIGVGLSISRAIARRLGGDIELESEVGEGSVFRILLPVESEFDTRDERSRGSAVPTPQLEPVP